MGLLTLGFLNSIFQENTHKKKVHKVYLALSHLVNGLLVFLSAFYRKTWVCFLSNWYMLENLTIS